MAPVGLPVVVRVKRKRDLDPVDTIVVEADETPAAKRRARDAALAAELDAVLDAGLAGGPGGSKDAGDARGRDAADGEREVAVEGALSSSPCAASSTVQSAATPPAITY